jgi:hypothetical protein
LPTVVVVTNKGRDIISNRVKGAGTEPKNAAWGTGAGDAAITDTALFSEDATPGYARVAGISTQETIGVANDTYQVIAVIIAQAALAITNHGLFDALVGGSLFFKASFAAINLDEGDSITFTDKVQFA